MTTDPESRLKDLGVTLPSPAKALGAYKPLAQSGDFVFVSGTLPFDAAGKIVAGRLGDGFSIEQGKEAARLACVTALAALKNHLGSLTRVQQVVRAVGHILAAPDFQDHAQVMDGASEFLAEVFGERGRHARLSLGAASLPKGAAVELELIVEVSRT